MSAVFDASPVGEPATTTGKWSGRAWLQFPAFAIIAAFMGGPGRKVFDGIAWFDRTIIDGAVNGVAAVVRAGGGWHRTVQSGYVRNYALGVAAGAIVLVALILTRAVGLF